MLNPGKNSLDIGLIVQDLSCCFDFYHRLLGLKYVETVRLWYGEMIRLKFGESEFKLIKPDEQAETAQRGLYRITGFRLVTFRIKEIEKTCEALKKEGVEFLIPLKESLPGVKISMMFDPEGNIVELVEK
ncbi:MAG: VOC family protein [Candidatus Humimicrobiaceae bacterium]